MEILNKTEGGYTKVRLANNRIAYRNPEGKFCKQQSYAGSKWHDYYEPEISPETHQFTGTIKPKKPLVKKLIEKPIVPEKEIRRKTYFRWHLLYFAPKGGSCYPFHFNNNSINMLVYHKGIVPLNELKEQVLRQVLPYNDEYYKRGCKIHGYEYFEYHYFVAFWNGRQWVIEKDTEKYNDVIKHPSDTTK